MDEIVQKQRAVCIYPAGKLLPVRKDSKQHILLELLRKGSTLEEMAVALPGWKPSTIYAAMYWDLKKKGYGVTTEFTNGVAKYLLALPEGETVPEPYFGTRAVPGGIYGPRA